MKMPSISFYTLGCRLNQSETAVIQNTFEKKGYRIKNANEPSDIAVINTCTVTEKGDSDTRKIVNKINRLNPYANIALIGCQAQIQKENLITLPNVKWVIGTGKKMELASIINKSSGKPEIIVPTIKKETFKNPDIGLYRNHTRANIKIQDGCDFFCSFCEIPFARGRARSRNFKDIIKEAKALSIAGHKEIVITGINVGTYNESGKTLLDVINVIEQISKIKRIRISSIEPTTIAKDIVNKMAGKTKLCRYMHIPIQSGCNKVLKLMKRKYSYEEFKEFIDYTSEKVPNICLGTDVIVGFPGERDADFKETYNNIITLKVNYLHVFSYSKRNLAKSKDFPGPVSIDIIKQRSKLMRNISTKKRNQFFRSALGSIQKVLFEQRTEGLWTGFTDNYIKVYIKSKENLSNKIKKVKLINIQNNKVYGEVIR